jgi:F-type H+-transporting ATPase subunit b
MNLNATLLVQILCFVVFVWVTMKYIWPPIVSLLEKRRDEIADGLAAAEQGKKDLELAHHKSKEILTDAKTQAAQIVEQANQRGNRILEDAKAHARTEGERLLSMAKEEITQEYNGAKETLLKQISGIAIAGAEKILQSEVDKASNDRLVNELVSEI